MVAGTCACRLQSPTMTGLRLLCALCLTMTIACDEEEPAPTEPEGPIVGALELPISLRHGAAPSGAVRIELAPDRLRVDSHTILEVEEGAIPMSERSAEQINKLADALRNGPARRSAQLRLYASAPYLTTALIVSTLKAANISQIAFEVRKGQTPDIGYLALDNFGTRLESEEWAEVPATHQRHWDELAPHWAAMYSSCRENHYVDCAFKPGTIATGGKMQMTLFARGNAIKIELHQFEAPEQPTKVAPALLDGIAADPVAVDESEPVTTAAFTWRFVASTTEPSVVSSTMRPLCGAQKCGAMITAEAQTATMRILSLVGAAFPNGTDAPYLLFQIPRR